MRELVFFEYKKMMKRKSVWISVCAMLFVVLLCSNLSLLGSVYVDDHRCSAILKKSKSGVKGEKSLKVLCWKRDFWKRM